ncbi:MAG: NAD(P)H-hydrate dehydratase [Bacteroidales bacterium]|nr:NAD(P)H-hydrate dehydratase [Bacteroidales bacterium]
MKFFTTSQIRQLDQYTIEHEPINSVDLMERAADALYCKYLQVFSYQKPVYIFAGPGNNGGDALALARMLLNTGLTVKVTLLSEGKLSSDCEVNRQRLAGKYPDSLMEMNNEFFAPEIPRETIIIDGLFGSGLTRPLTGIFAEAVHWINESGCEVLAIDVPSGLHGENNPDLSVPVVKAGYTFSLQFPKLSFFFAENAKFVGKWEILEIGIHPKVISETGSYFSVLEKPDIRQIIRTRPEFSHKGTFGHLLLLAGSKDMAGAAVLSARGALRGGAGLVSVHSPECNRAIVQTAIPEAIFHSDKNQNMITEFPDLGNYSALAIGPGIGTKAETAEMLNQLLSQLKNPCLLDADALNIIAQNKHLLGKIPAGSILTPHPKEFERLFGASSNSFERMQKAGEMAVKYQLTIIVKGAHTLIAQPDGQLVFNNTGNAGMATAGSGDVLTGILGSLLAQGYSPNEAAKLGVYLHGLAGDMALRKQSEESMIAGDIIENLGLTFKSLKTE